MPKIGLLTVAAAVILAGAGAWLASSTHARVDAAAADARIDPMRMMVEARDLPVAILVDFSTVE
jgi:hypothetical protein